jgi:hypothetical protein
MIKALLLILSYQLIMAAPYPMTGSSLFLDTQKNLFLTPLGFSLNLEKTQARLNLQSNDPEKWVVTFPDQKLLFTMRSRLFETDLDYEKSIKTWLKDYQKSGLKIIQENIRSRKPQKGWIHLEDPTGRQILQYFTYSKNLWVFFGCVGPQSEVQELHSKCELLNSRVRRTDEIMVSN